MNGFRTCYMFCSNNDEMIADMETNHEEKSNCMEKLITFQQDLENFNALYKYF